MANMTEAVQPGRSIGFLTLGASLHDVLTRIKGSPEIYPKIDLSFSQERPLTKQVILSLPHNGLRLRFDGPDQRLRLIEVLDFASIKLTYKGVNVTKSAEGNLIPKSSISGASGPSFRHVYQLFGITFPGEYHPPPEGDLSGIGTYILSYSGVAFTFPLRASAWSDRADFVTMMGTDAAGTAVALAVYEGKSWPEARQDLFTRKPINPRSLELAGRGIEGVPDEIEHVRIYGEGRLEMLRRSSTSFWITLNESTPQDLITELGPPDAIHKKEGESAEPYDAGEHIQSRNDAYTVGQQALSDVSGSAGSTGSHSSNVTDTYETEFDDDDSPYDPENLSSNGLFYCYFSHGFDILVSNPMVSSPSSPAIKRASSVGGNDAEDCIDDTRQTVTKVILHGNVPGSFPFNRHRRSRWTLDHIPDPSSTSTEPLTSEMSFSEIKQRLESVFRHQLPGGEVHKGMVVNRGWADSPASSAILLDDLDDLNSTNEQGLPNTQLFEFPGLVFEVLDNDYISALTVY
ncbi:hypothetical protein LTR50_007000 [Elasticomyces elasticus]|nr:hypothetical protein LTR50_007000 [Elasticomyces elasticus]